MRPLKAPVTTARPRLRPIACREARPNEKGRRHTGGRPSPPISQSLPADAPATPPIATQAATGSPAAAAPTPVAAARSVAPATPAPVLHLDHRIGSGRPVQDGDAARRRSGCARHSAERNPGRNSQTKKDTTHCLLPRCHLTTTPIAGALCPDAGSIIGLACPDPISRLRSIERLIVSCLKSAWVRRRDASHSIRRITNKSRKNMNGSFIGHSSGKHGSAARTR